VTPPSRDIPWALAIIAAMMILLWLQGTRHGFVPCVVDCGETFVAMEQAQTFAVTGFSYGLIQDHATSDRVQAHPFLYTHNVSIAAVLFPLLEALGITPLWAKQLLSLFVYGLGLFYVFRATLYHTRSTICAFTLLILFCGDLLGVFSFGLNALRTWHWLAIFGLLFHAGRLAIDPARAPWRDRLAVAALALVAFGIGYDYWVICFLIAIFMALAYLPPPRGYRLAFANVVWIGFAFGLPFILRQVHIATVLGAEFWWKDFVYSAGIKVPFLRDIISLPTVNEIDAFYRQHHVLRAPATQASSWGEITRTLADMTEQILLPTYGVISIGIVVVLSAVAVVVLFFSSLVMCVLKSPRVREKLYRVVYVAEALPSSLNAFFRESASSLVRGIQTNCGRALPRVCLPIALDRWLSNSCYICLVLTIALIIESVLRVTLRPTPPTLYVGAFLAIALVAVITAVTPSLSKCRSDRPISETADSLTFLGLLLPVAFSLILLWLGFASGDHARISYGGAGALIFLVAAAMHVFPVGRRIRVAVRSAFPYIRSFAAGYGRTFHSATLVVAGIVLAVVYARGFGLRPGIVAHLLLACLLVEVFHALRRDCPVREEPAVARGDRALFLGSNPRLANWAGINLTYPEFAALLQRPAWRSARFLAVLVLATGVGLAIFAPLSLHIYIKHGFPLLSAPMWLAKALLVTAMLAWFWQLFLARRAARFAVLAVLPLIAADHIAVQADNIRSAQAMDTSWMQAVARAPEASYVVTWIADSVASLSQGWVAGILAGSEDRIERRLRDGARPFEFSDYFLFGQRDLSVMGDAYLRPDFFLYLITDRQNQFDSPDPVCRRDYLTSFLENIRPRRARPPNAILWAGTPGTGMRLPPGGHIALGGLLDVDPRDVERIELRSEGNPPLVVSYNCIYRSFVGIYQIPDGFGQAIEQVRPAVVYRDGREFELGKLDLIIDRQAPRRMPSDLLPWSRHKQKDVAAFIADNPSLPVTARGRGFALFDMRPLFMER
jgi:hypothetical protein